MTKKVTLRRKDVLNHLPKQVRAEAVIKLSSVYVNRQPLKAFSPEDEIKYMKGYLDVSPDHMEWPKHSKEFWANLTVPVGFTGVELEIGVNEDGSPIKIDDFIKYRFALKQFLSPLNQKALGDLKELGTLGLEPRTYALKGRCSTN